MSTVEQQSSAPMICEAGRTDCRYGARDFWRRSRGLMSGRLENVTVDGALHFFVNTGPDAIPYNFKQAQGFGSHAKRLSAPIEFTPLAGGQDH